MEQTVEFLKLEMLLDDEESKKMRWVIKPVTVSQEKKWSSMLQMSLVSSVGKREPVESAFGIQADVFFFWDVELPFFKVLTHPVLFRFDDS